jgi:hypothetical protein
LILEPWVVVNIAPSVLNIDSAIRIAKTIIRTDAIMRIRGKNNRNISI